MIVDTNNESTHLNPDSHPLSSGGMRPVTRVVYPCPRVEAVSEGAGNVVRVKQ